MPTAAPDWAQETVPDWAAPAALATGGTPATPDWAKPQPLTPEFMASAGDAMAKDEAQRQAIARGMESGTEFVSTVANDPIGAVQAVPQIALGALTAPGKLAYYAAADVVSQLPTSQRTDTGDVVTSRGIMGQFGGNLEALKRGETLPVEKFLNQVAVTNPKMAVGGKLGRDLSAMSGLGVIGALPAGLAKLAAAGFTVDMIAHAPEQFQQYADEINKPPAEQDAGKISDLRSGILQTFAFAPLAGSHGAKGVPEAVVRDFKYAFDVAEGRVGRAELPLRREATQQRRPTEPAEEGAPVPEGRTIEEARAFKELREEGVSSWDAEQLLSGNKSVNQVVSENAKRFVTPAWDANVSQVNGGHAEAWIAGYNQALERLTSIMSRARPPVPDWAASEIVKEREEVTDNGARATATTQEGQGQGRTGLLTKPPTEIESPGVSQSDVARTAEAEAAPATTKPTENVPAAASQTAPEQSLPTFKRQAPQVAQPLALGGKSKLPDGTYGQNYAIPGFEEYRTVLLKPEGNKAKGTKVGWRVVEATTGLDIAHPRLNLLEDSPQSALELARKKMSQVGKAKLDELIQPKQAAPAKMEDGGSKMAKAETPAMSEKEMLASVSNQANRKPYVPLDAAQLGALVAAGDVHSKGPRKGRLTEQGQNKLTEYARQDRVAANEDYQRAMAETPAAGDYKGQEETYRLLLNESVKTARGPGQIIDMMLADGVSERAAIKLSSDYYANFGRSEFARWKAMQPGKRGKAETPAAAVAKVQEHVAEVASGEKTVKMEDGGSKMAKAQSTGPRPAKEIKSELVQRLEAEIEKLGPEPELLYSDPRKVKGRREFSVFSPDKSQRLDVREGRNGDWIIEHPAEWQTSVKGKTTGTPAREVARSWGDIRAATRVAASAMEKVLSGDKPRITIEIPGDGTFTIERTHAALNEVLRRAQALNTASGAPTRKSSPPGEVQIPDTVALRRNGENWILEGQKLLDFIANGKAPGDAKAIDWVRGLGGTRPGFATAIEDLTRIGDKHNFTLNDVAEYWQQRGRDIIKHAAQWETLKMPVEKQPATPPATAEPAATTSKPEIIGMGGAVPAEFAREAGTATSIKNATVDLERQRRGLPPAMQPARRSFGDVWDEAMAIVDRAPETQDRLIAELKQRPRAVTDLEDALLLHQQIDLQNEYGKATRELAQAYDDAQSFPNRLEAVESAKARVQWASDRLQELYDINKAVGTATARGLAARKMMAFEDFTLAKMELELRAAKGGAQLTDSERARVVELESKIREWQQKFDDYVAKAEAAKADRRVEETIADLEAELKRRPNYDSRVVKIAEEIVGKLEKQADAARLRLKAKFGRTSAGVDPTIAYDLGVIGAAKIARLGLDFTKFGVEMVKEFGDEVKPYLQAAWERANLHLDNEGAKYGDKAEPVKRLLRKQDELGRRENIVKGIQKGKAEDMPLSLMGDYVRRLAESFVKAGVRERNALIDAVHEVLTKEAGLEITRRETMDAISGYGQFKALNPNEVKATLRDLRGQMQQVAKLEDIQARKPLSKTGVERRAPSDEERRLLQQVNEAKRRFGVVVSDPARQLKSALDAVRTRLKHQIADLEYQINTKERIVKTKTPSPFDAETRLLETRRDELRRQLDELLPKPGITDAQRLAAAQRNVERSIADLEQRIATGNTAAPAGKSTVTSPQLEALKARREALRAEWEALRDAADPGRAERAALSALKSRLATRIAEYQDRIARGDFSRRQVRELHLDAEAMRLKAESERWKAEYHKQLILARMKLRSPGRKIFDTAKEMLNLPRNILSSWDVSAVLRQGGFITLGHPIRALSSMGPMFKALASRSNALALEQSILNRPNAARYAQAKLYLAPVESARLSAMEEQLMSRFAHRVPGLAASNRAYIMFLNKLRADSFDAMVKSIEDRGTPLNQPELEAIGNYINVATGRGNLYQFTPAAETLATVFFSPRLMASRFQLLAGQPLYHGSARTRLAVAKEYSRFLAGMAAVYALAQFAGATVEDDPRSADFGKLRLGNTRVDPLAGLSQTSVLVGRLAMGETKNADGAIKPIRGAKLPFGSDTSADVVFRFLRSKLSPIVGGALDVVSGQNLMGEPTTPASVASRLAVPLSFQDIYEAMKDQGVPKGTALAMLSLLGWGLQVYDTKAKDATTVAGAQMQSLGLNGLPTEARAAVRSNLVQSLSAQDAKVLNAMAESIRMQRGDTNALRRAMKQ